MLIVSKANETVVSKDMAKRIERYLVKNDYIDDNDGITQAYHDAREAGTLAALSAEKLAREECASAGEYSC